MAIDFQPLHQAVQAGQTSWYRLEQSGIDNRTIDRIRHNRNVTLKTIEKLCTILDCQPQDIIRYVKEQPEKPTGCGGSP